MSRPALTSSVLGTSTAAKGAVGGAQSAHAVVVALKIAIPDYTFSARDEGCDGQ